MSVSFDIIPIVKNDYGCRVVANARLLYARLAVSTTVEMVVARLVLDALGVKGYGLFAAASGGLAALFFFNGALEAAARRFVCYDKANFAPLLGLTLTLSACVGLLGVVLSVFFFAPSLSLLFPLLGVLVLNVLRLPYEACVVAGERMGFFLGLSLAESALSLLSALAIPLFPFCPLTTYATLRLVSAVLASAIVLAYCRRHYAESRARPVFRFSKIKTLLGFFTWHALGSVAGLLKGSGIVLLLATYAGTSGCAAYEAAAKITILLWGLIANYRMAYLPGIVKAWADGKKDSFVLCAARAFRFSAVGMTILSVPIVILAPQICRVWLGADMPPMSDMFMRMFVLQFFFEALATPLDTAVLATGRIARYEIMLTIVIGTSFVFAWTFLLLGLPAWTATGAVALANVFACLYRFVYLKVFHRIAIRAWFVRCDA